MENNKTPSERATELYHHGTKGMKWGVRRYQNEDGTLTEEGKKRYDRDTAGKSDKEKKRYVTDPEKWVSEDISNTKKIADDGSAAMRKIGESNDAAIRSAPKAKMDLSKMSDKELRDAVNRYNLEQQYTNAFAPSTVSKGQVIFGEIVKGIGTALSLTGTALGIALSIRALQGKG